MSRLVNCIELLSNIANMDDQT